MVSIKDYPLVPITDVLSFIVDNRGKTVPTAETGTPLIATNCILNERLYPVFENLRYVSDNILKTWFRAHLQPNDILFVNKGTPGRCCLVPDPVTFCVAQDMIGLRCDEQRVYYRYLLMVLRSPYIQKIIRNNHVGLVIPHFKKENLSQLMIPLPDMEVQTVIGDLYFHLCDKIENNIAICSDLEGMAKLLYDYWFVQFDFPDENGKPYKSSGGKMVWNEKLKREIPAGWEVGSFESIFYLERGVSYSTSDLIVNGIPMINLGSFAICGGYRDGYLKSYGGNYHESKKISPYDLILCLTQQTDIDPSKDVIGCALLVPDIFDSDIVISQDLTKVVCSDELKFYLVQYFNTNYFHKYITGYASGSNILHLDTDGVLKHLTCFPPKDLLKKYAEIVKPMWEKKSKYMSENQQLTSLRDFLLPMLMNGQVKVEKAEK